MWAALVMVGVMLVITVMLRFVRACVCRERCSFVPRPRPPTALLIAASLPQVPLSSALPATTLTSATLTFTLTTPSSLPPPPSDARPSPTGGLPPGQVLFHRQSVQERGN
jgi:hypothetical protein